MTGPQGRPGQAPAGLRRRLVEIHRGIRAVLVRHDLSLLAAGTTYYAALAVVPLLLVAIWAAARLAGRQRVLDLGDDLRDVLPGALGAGDVAQTLVELGVALPPFAVGFGALAATIYGEGLRRAYARLAEVDEGARVGWRGRVAVLPLLGAAPMLLLVALSVTPLMTRLFSGGAGPTLLGIWLALTVVWLVISPPLVFSYRVVSPTPIPWRAAVVGGFTAGAFVSGFLQGFTLFLSLPIDLGAPFGGAVVVGAVTALLLWLWVLHVVVLYGYVATRVGARTTSVG